MHRQLQLFVPLERHLDLHRAFVVLEQNRQLVVHFFLGCLQRLDELPDDDLLLFGVSVDLQVIAQQIFVRHLFYGHVNDAFRKVFAFLPTWIWLIFPENSNDFDELVLVTLRDRLHAEIGNLHARIFLLLQQNLDVGRRVNQLVQRLNAHLHAAPDVVVRTSALDVQLLRLVQLL